MDVTVNYAGTQEVQQYHTRLPRMVILLVEDGDSSDPTDSWASLELKYEGLNRMRSGERSYMVDVEAVEAKELTQKRRGDDRQ